MCCIRIQSIVKLIEIYFRVDLVLKFSFNGSPRDVDVKFLNAIYNDKQSLFIFSNENPSY